MKSIPHSDPLSRSRFDGVKEIARFNWPWYVFATALIAAGGTLLVWPETFSNWIRIPIIATAVMAAYWSAASLIVSHWVYDRSELYRWKWLGHALPRNAERWLVISAGFDVATTGLSLLLPNTTGRTVDIYNQALMTEASIARARKENPGTRVPQVSHNCLPFPDREFDVVVLPFAAHELRCRAGRKQLFAETRRILKAHGSVILVEHFRDGWNFAAFGPGFMHFLTRRTWLEALGGSGLALAEVIQKTPFVSAFVLKNTP